MQRVAGLGIHPGSVTSLTRAWLHEDPSIQGAPPHLSGLPSVLTYKPGSLGSWSSSPPSQLLPLPWSLRPPQGPLTTPWASQFPDLLHPESPNAFSPLPPSHPPQHILGFSPSYQEHHPLFSPFTTSDLPSCKTCWEQTHGPQTLDLSPCHPATHLRAGQLADLPRDHFKHGLFPSWYLALPPAPCSASCSQSAQRPSD